VYLIKTVLLRLCLLSALFLPVQFATAQDWQHKTYQENLFAINMPGEPDISTFNYASEWGGSLPATLYSLDVNDVEYRLTVVLYGTADSIYSQVDDHTDDDFPWLYDIRGSIAYAAHNIRKRGGEITYDAWHHIEMVEGHQLQISHEDGSRTYAGIYLYEEEGRLYIIEAKVPEGGLPQGLFQQSINFLDKEGNRVRYLLHPDGSETKRTDLDDQYE